MTHLGENTFICQRTQILERKSKKRTGKIDIVESIKFGGKKARKINEQTQYGCSAGKLH